MKLLNMLIFVHLGMWILLVAHLQLEPLPWMTIVHLMQVKFCKMVIHQDHRFIDAAASEQFGAWRTRADKFKEENVMGGLCQRKKKESETKKQDKGGIFRRASH